MSRNTPKNHWGKHLWAFLHTMSICDLNVNEANLRTQKPLITNIKWLANSIPCDTCKSHFVQNLHSLDALDLNESNVLFNWTVDFHNNVNEKLNKPIITYKEAEIMWCNKSD